MWKDDRSQPNALRNADASIQALTNPGADELTLDLVTLIFFSTR
jgi:hypothetical protein